MIERPERAEPEKRGGAETVALLVELLDADPATLTDGELSDAVLALDRLRSQVDAAAAMLAGEWDSRLVWAADGARRGASWIAARGEVSPPAAGALLKRARALRACPAVTAAHRQGFLGTQKVAMLMEARRGFEALFAEHEAELVRHIRPLTVEEARKAIAHWLELARSDKPSTDGRPPADTTDKIRLTRGLGGRWDVVGDLDPLSGEILGTAIRDEVELLWKQGTFANGDGLTPAQRDGHALIELVRRGIEPGSRHGEPRPLAHVVIDAEALLGHPVDSFSELGRRRCELALAGPVDRAVAEQILCDGVLSIICIQRRPDGTCEVLDASPNLPSATAAQRRALRQRDGGCVFPGCDAPVERCDAHHIQFRSLGGPTVLDNLALLCRFHHGRVHRGGFSLARTSEGQIVVRRPDGTPMATAPPGHQLPFDEPGSDHPPDRDSGTALHHDPRAREEDASPSGGRVVDPCEVVRRAFRDPEPRPFNPWPRSRFRPLAEQTTDAERAQRRRQTAPRHLFRFRYDDIFLDR